MIVLKKLGGIRLPALVALCAALVMLVCLFLPYTVANDSLAAALDNYSDTVVDEEFKLTGAEMESFSMFDLSLYLKEINTANQDELLGWIYMSLLITCGLFGLLTMLFPLLDKAIPTALFALLTFAPYYLYSLDLTQRGFVGEHYEWGFGYYLFHAAVVVAIAGAVWLFIEKWREKKAAKK